MAASNDDDGNADDAELIASVQRRFKRRWKVVFGIILLLSIVLLIIDGLTSKFVPSVLNDFLEWVERNPAEGCVAMCFVYILATCLFVPGSALTLGTGFALAKSFGLWKGLALSVLSVFVGATIGSIFSFLLARYLLRERVRSFSKLYPLFQAVNLAPKKEGFRIMLLLRLSPLIPVRVRVRVRVFASKNVHSIRCSTNATPAHHDNTNSLSISPQTPKFNAINYIVGTTNMSLRDYALAEVGILPGTILFCYFGATAGSLSSSEESVSSDPTTKIFILIIGIFFGIAAVATTSVYAKRELRSLMEAKTSTEMQ